MGEATSASRRSPRCRRVAPTRLGWIVDSRPTHWVPRPRRCAREVKQEDHRGARRVGTLTSLHEKYARIALKLVSDIPNPPSWNLVRSHGKLSAKILELHPTATVTISIRSTSVAASPLGRAGTHPRARTSDRQPPLTTTTAVWRSSRWHFTTAAYGRLQSDREAHRVGSAF